MHEMCPGSSMLLHPALFVFMATCSWGPNWGLRGSFKIAYGSAYVMQPDYTFALQFNRSSTTEQATRTRQRLAPDLARDPAQPGCLLYSPKQPQRLVKLTDDLTILATTAPTVALRIRKPDVLADVITSNLGFVCSLLAASKGPFRVCGRTAHLLSSVMIVLGGSIRTYPPTAVSQPT
jgi:hypothetical protein